MGLYIQASMLTDVLQHYNAFDSRKQTAGTSQTEPPFNGTFDVQPLWDSADLTAKYPPGN